MERQLILVVDAKDDQRASELLAVAASAMPTGSVKRTALEPFPPAAVQASTENTDSAGHPADFAEGKR